MKEITGHKSDSDRNYKNSNDKILGKAVLQIAGTNIVENSSQNKEVGRTSAFDWGEQEMITRILT